MRVSINVRFYRLGEVSRLSRELNSPCLLFQSCSLPFSRQAAGRPSNKQVLPLDVQVLQENTTSISVFSGPGDQLQILTR
jgi:hypothetical protein